MKIKHIIKKRWVRILLILLMPPLLLIAACTGLFSYDAYCNSFLFLGWSGGHSYDPSPVALLPRDTSHIRPRWTPDGSQIVFSTFYIDAGDGAYVVSSDGSSLSSIGGVSLSSDGTRIAYPVGDTGVDSIETSALDGSGRQKIRVDDVRRGRSFVWSPDDSSLAFLRLDDRNFAIIGCPDLGWRDEVIQGIYAANMEDVGGSDIRKVAQWKAFVRSGESETTSYLSGLSWSPDGRFLAFVGEHRMRNEGGITEEGSLQSVLYTVAADGSEMRELFTASGRDSIARFLSWSPDSRRIAFMAYGDDPDTGLYLYTIDPDGSDLREVVAVNHILDEMSGGGLSHGSVDWSPDGSRILFSLSAISASISSHSYYRDLSPVGALYVTDVDGIDVRSIGEGVYASWSPDGSRIANLMPYGSDVVLSTMSPDGTDVRALVRRWRRSGVFESIGPDQRPSATVASCSAGVVVADPDANPSLVRDCETLVKMIDRFVVVGLNWNADTPISEWVGVVSDAPSGRDDPGSSPSRVRGLSLSEMSTLGGFRDAVTELTGLRLLDLSSTGLHGGIPAELGNLSSLRELNLSRNSLSGEIPAELGNLSALESLDLTWNNLSGSIPAELGNLSALERLGLGNLSLTGCIPVELGERLRAIDALLISPYIPDCEE